MEISYSKKSLIKIKAKFNPTFLSSLIFFLTEKETSFVKIVINFKDGFKISIDDPIIKEINKFRPDILISPVFQESSLISSKMQEEEYFDQIKNSDSAFFELLKNNSNEALNFNGYLIDEPGEYEIKNTYIKSVESLGTSKTESDLNEIKNLSHIYVFESEEIKFCCFWGIPEKKLTVSQLNAIGNIDIVILSYKIKDLEDYLKILNFIEETNPLLVIFAETPSDDADNAILDIETYKNSPEIKDFIKQIGEEKAMFVDKLKIQKKDIIKVDKKFIFLKEVN